MILLTSNMAAKNYKTIDERQRFVQKSGKDWENQVMNFVNRGLRSLGSNLAVIKGSAISKNTPLWNKLAIPVGPPGSQQKIWGDIDLAVIDGSGNPFAVISCKVSLHGRFSETLFYAVVLKELVSSIKVLFATPDKGRQQKGTWQSEWGSEERPTKDRKLGPHYLDGIYILNKKTKLGGMVKPLEALHKDLVNWEKGLS